MKRIAIISGLILLGTMLSFGQVIDTARFRLNFVPQMSNVQKINQQAVLNDTNKDVVKFDYSITPVQMDVTFTPAPIKTNKLGPEPQDTIARNFIKFGFGYPITPLLDFSAHNTNNSKFSYGINFHHFSSWAGQIGKKQKQYAYAPTSDTRVHLFLTRFFKNQTLYSSLGYNHELAHLYGFNKDIYGEGGILGFNDNYYDKSYRDTLRNDFHHLKAEVGIRSNYVLGEKKLKQDVRLNYDFLYTHHKDMENHIGVNSFFAYDARFMKVSGSQNYRIDFNFDYFNDKFNDAGLFRSANAFKVEFVPSMNFTIKEYHILVGVGVPILHSNGKTRCPVYPVAEVQLGIVPSIMSIYFGVKGDVKYQGMKELLYENPYFTPSFDTLEFARNRISIYGGIKGNLVKKLNYHVSANYSYVQGMAFFQIDTTALLANQFNVLYKDVNKLNVCVNLEWEVIDHLSLGLEANYNGYFFRKGSNIEHAWYKPSFDVGFDGRYTLKEKFIFDLNFTLEFGRWALAPRDAKGNLYIDESTGAVCYKATKMKPVIDFGIGFEYLITKNFSAFATINNIGCQYYAKYYDFNSFGINALIGITYSFGKDSIKNVKKSK